VIITTPVDHVIDNRFHWLRGKAFTRHSQNGEDGLLKAIFEVIGTQNKWCFECGAADGVTISNTITLVEKGWTGIFVERNRRRFVEMERRHNSPGARRMGIDKRSIRIKAELAVNGPCSIEAICKQHSAPMDIDLISLDIDGGEEDVLLGFRELKPRVICAEYFAPENVHLDEMLFTLDRMGYTPVAQTLCNVIAVRDEFDDSLSRNT
jgi:hypothetical protein